MVRYEDNPGTSSHEYRPYDRHEDRFDSSRTNGGSRGRFGRTQWDEEWRRGEGPRSARPYGEEFDSDSVDRWRNEGGSQPMHERGRDWRNESSEYGSRGYTGSGSIGQGYGSRGFGERGGYGGGSGYGHREFGSQIGDNWRAARPGEWGGGYSGAGGFGGAGGYGAMPGGQVSGEFTTGHSGQWNRENDRWQGARGPESRGGWSGAGTTESHRGKGPKGYRRSDERIREDVCDALTDDARIDASSVEIDVSSGEVKLNGTIGCREDKRRVEDLVERISGVRDVQNNLKVQEKDKSRSGGLESSSTGGSSSMSSPASASSAATSGAAGSSRNR